MEHVAPKPVAWLLRPARAMESSILSSSVGSAAASQPSSALVIRISAKSATKRSTHSLCGRVSCSCCCRMWRTSCCMVLLSILMCSETPGAVGARGQPRPFETGAEVLLRAQARPQWHTANQRGLFPPAAVPLHASTWCAFVVPFTDWTAHQPMSAGVFRLFSLPHRVFRGSTNLDAPRALQAAAQAL